MKTEQSHRSLKSPNHAPVPLFPANSILRFVAGGTCSYIARANKMYAGPRLRDGWNHMAPRSVV